MFKQFWILAFLLPNFIIGQDSIIKPKRNQIYFSLEARYNFYTSGLYQTKYADGSWAHIKGADFNFKTPAFGFGHIFSNHNLFLRNEISFWYGLKKVNYSDEASPRTGPPAAAGTIVTRNYDYFKGNVDYFNIDWDIAFGIGRRSKLGMFIGFKRNFIPYYSVAGELQRTIVSYQDNWNYAPPTNRTEYVEIYQGNEIKKVWSQSIYGTTYINIGFSMNFKINESSYFSELTLSVPYPIFYNEFEMHFVKLKVAKYFGSKKKG